MTMRPAALAGSGGVLRPVLCPIISFHRSVYPLSLRPRERRRAHQVIGDDAESHPSLHPVEAMVATAVQSVASFQYADPSFRADTPSLAPTKPALTFMGAARRRLRPTPRQDHSSHTPLERVLFIARRTESAIAGREIRRPPKHLMMLIERARPQRDVRGPLRVHFVGGHDVVLRFLDRDQLAKLLRFGDLSFPDRFRVRFEDAQHFVRHMRVPTKDPHPRMSKDALDHRLPLTLLV